MRLFVAIEFPAAWHEAAASVVRELERVTSLPLRHVDPSRLHLTLRFLGEVPAEQIEVLQDALARYVPPVDVTLALGSPGTFGAGSRTALVYLDTTGEGLDALAARVEAAVRAAGLPGDDRPFLPHVTIARLHRSLPAGARRAVAAAAHAMPAPAVGSLRVREVVLVHSILGAAPRYEVLARVRG